MKKISQLVLVIFFVSLIIPNLVFASWWNPFSWFGFNKTEKKETVVQVATSTIQTVTPTTTPITILKKNNIPTVKTVVTPESIITQTKVPTDPRLIIVTNFLDNPTLEKFKILCNQAKNIEGYQVEKILDSSRENLITKKLSFYYDIPDCVNYDKRGRYYLSLDTNLLIPLKDADSNLIREIKLLYNEKINNLISSSTIRFVLFENSGFGDAELIHKVSTPIELFDYSFSNITDQNDLSAKNSMYMQNIKLLIRMVSDLSKNFNDLKLKIK